MAGVLPRLGCWLPMGSKPTVDRLDDAIREQVVANSVFGGTGRIETY